MQRVVLLITELTASQTMFHAVGTIMEGVDWGKNAVTSALEHPSAHDAVEYYCKKTGREFREVPANKVTGGLDPDEIMKYVIRIRFFSVLWLLPIFPVISWISRRSHIVQRDQPGYLHCK